MKIHFIVSLKTPSEIKEKMLSLAQKLTALGHTVNTTRLVNDIKGKPEYNESELNAYHKKMIAGIKQCDVIIAEISSKSSGLGYEIAVALNERKPILALFSGPASENSSLSLKSNPSKLISVRKYSDDNLEALTKEFIDDARNKIDTKFILIISPEIDKYLTWASEERRMHKAQLVREAIEEQLGKDKEYQAYLKAQDV